MASAFFAFLMKYYLYKKKKKSLTGNRRDLGFKKKMAAKGWCFWVGLQTRHECGRNLLADALKIVDKKNIYNHKEEFCKKSCH